MTGCLESISLLLEAGSNLSCFNSEGKNGLHLAVAAGAVDSVDYLLSMQSFLAHSGDSNGATPVHYASVASPVIVGSFVCAGVSFLVQDHDGDTPLHWSCRESSVENVSLIYGTNQMLKEVSNSEGETPFQLALLYEEEEICQIFGGKSAGVEDNHTVHNIDISNVQKEVSKTSQFSNAWGVKPSSPQFESRNLFGFGTQLASVN
jgi:ankyrin repeat protein